MIKSPNVRIEMVPEEAGVSFEWDSYEDFEKDRADLAVQKPRFKKYADETSNAGGMNWLGVDDGYEGVYRRVRNGWPELREATTRMMKGIELELPMLPSYAMLRKRKIRRDDHGDQLDMPRVWNGELETAWSRPARTERMSVDTRRITLAFDVTANASIKNSQAMWRAALCMLLVDAMARAGRIMEVWVIDSTAYPFKMDSTRQVPLRLWSGWCAKRTNDPIVMDRLCAMVSVGYMRTVGFTAYGCGPWDPSATFGSALNTGLTRTLRDRQKAGEIVLRIGECYSREQCVDEYKRACAEVEAASRPEVV